MAVAKASILHAVTIITRWYIRYGPLRLGKLALFNRIVRPYVLWRSSVSAICTTFFGAKMSVALPDNIQTRIYFFGCWEPELTKLLKLSLKEGDRFIDVGANIGYFSLLASSLVGRSGRVHAIEASPTIFEQLKHNVNRNHCTNVQAYNMAASDTEGLLPIFLAGKGNLGGTTTLAAVACRDGHTYETQVVAKPLASIIGEDELLGARLIKIDVEGAEAAVIKGIERLLPRCSQQTEWVIEVTPERIGHAETQTLLSTFVAAGYRLYHLENDYGYAGYTSPDRHPKIWPLQEVQQMTDIFASKTYRPRSMH